MKYIQVCCGITVVLLLIVLGIFIGQKTAKCPKITIGQEIIIDSVIVHDTIISKKQFNDIKAEIKIIKQINKDTLNDSIAITENNDTTTCFSIEEIENDGANIKASICSDSFKLKPSDLHGEIIYQAAPDSIKIISRVDTVAIIQTVPFYKDWKTYMIMILSSLIAGSILISNK